MGLTLASIRRPVFISMVVLALVIMGFRARQNMPKEANPDVEFPFVTVVTVYAGAGPQEIETLVTKPLEDAVAGANGLKHITSTSRDGLSIIGLEFELGTNLDTASADVRDKVSAARNDLPREAFEPSISRLNITNAPVLTLGMAGSISPAQMRDLADRTVKDAFAKVPGVAAVYVDGGEVREIQVQVDKARLQAYGMSLSQVVTAINAQNLNIPSGTVKEEGREYAVRMVGEFTSVEEIRNVRIMVPSPTGAAPAIVRLGDVARVVDTVAEPDRITRLGVRNEEPIPAVTLAVMRQSGGNTIEAADGVKTEIAHLLGKIYDVKSGEIRDYNSATDGEIAPARVLPPGVDIIIATDDSEYVKNSLEDVNRSLIEGVLLVVLIVFVFLHSARATFIVSLAIPTAMFATFLPLSILGYTINFMTMLGLSLSVGILVDDSIVVLENIERHLSMGEEPREAALNGRSEIGLAAIAITLVDVVVFIPIANMGGIVGKFFRPFGYTVAIAALFSLFMSFTLTPMLASRFFKQGHGSDEHRAQQRGFWAMLFSKLQYLYDRGDAHYEGLLAWTLKNRSLTIWTGWATLFTVIAMMFTWQIKTPAGLPVKLIFAGVIVAMIAIGAAFSKDRLMGLFIASGLVAVALVTSLPLPFSFFPTVDRGEFTITVEGPSGQALPTTDRIVQQAAAVVQNLTDPKTGEPLVEYQTTTTGATSSGAGMGAGNAGSQYGSIAVKVVDRGDRTETLDEITRRVTLGIADIPGAAIRVQREEGIGGGKPITEEIVGPDMEQNVRVAEALMDKMRAMPGLINVETDWEVGKPEVQIIVDPVLAADHGLSAAQVGSAARTALQGSGDAGDTKFRESGNQYTIRVQYDKLDRSDVNEVSGLVVGTQNGAPVYLKDVATVSLAAAPNEIHRKDKQRVVTVDANLASGYSQGNMQNEVTRVAAAIPAGSSRINVGGTGMMMAESNKYMGAALALSVILVYMLMAALFESLTTPFVIWLSLPQALVGALLGLMVTNKALSVVSMIGIIMLMGLVTKNAILLIDYTNTLRSRGMDRTAAILKAGPTRLRPVMMTTFAMIGGMLPTAMAVSKGSEMRQPMAIAVIGGLILSTLLTLLVIPSTYALFDDMVSGSQKLWVGLVGRRGRTAPPAYEPETQPVGGD